MQDLLDDALEGVSDAGSASPHAVSVAFDNFEKIRAIVTNPDAHFLRNGSGPPGESPPFRFCVAPASLIEFRFHTTRQRDRRTFMVLRTTSASVRHPDSSTNSNSGCGDAARGSRLREEGDAVKFVASSVSLISILALASGAGCASEQKKVEKELTSPDPINCATAAGDIRVLQGEKANVAARVLEGATAIYPASAVLGLVAGVESTKLKVATGDYNKAIDERIALIKQTCGEPEAENP